MRPPKMRVVSPVVCGWRRAFLPPSPSERHPARTRLRRLRPPRVRTSASERSCDRLSCALPRSVTSMRSNKRGGRSYTLTGSRYFSTLALIRSLCVWQNPTSTRAPQARLIPRSLDTNDMLERYVPHFAYRFKLVIMERNRSCPRQ
jgi:hypothetical protein